MALTAEQTEQTNRVVDRLFALMKTSGLYGPTHPSTTKVGDELVGAVAEAGPPFSLRIANEALVRDRQLVPMPQADYAKFCKLWNVFERFGLEGLEFDAAVETAGACALGDRLAKSETDPNGATVEGLETPGIRYLDSLAAVAAGTSHVGRTPTRAAVTRAGVALTLCEEVCAESSGAWPFSTALSIVRRLDAGLEADRDALLRVVETLDEPWSQARRSVSLTTMTLATLLGCGASHAVARSAAHVALSLAVEGLRGESPLPLQEAARAALERFVAAPVPHKSGVTPHRLRANALLHHLAGQAPSHLPARLLGVLYQLEASRCEGEAQRSLVELLARAQRNADLDPALVSALSACLGPFPPGSAVRLRDGRGGVVVRGSERRWRVQVDDGAAKRVADFDLLLDVDLPALPGRAARVVAVVDAAAEVASPDEAPTTAADEAPATAADEAPAADEPELEADTLIKAPESPPADHEDEEMQIVVYHHGELLKAVPIAKEVTLVGRHESADLQIDDKIVSRRHCAVISHKNGFALVTGSTTNTTRIDGARVKGEVPLKPGQEVTLSEGYVLKVLPVGVDEPPAT